MVQPQEACQPTRSSKKHNAGVSRYFLVGEWEIPNCNLSTIR